MLYTALAFLTGDACLLFFKNLPDLTWLLLFLLASILGIILFPKPFKNCLCLLAVFLLGLSWGTFSAGQILKDRLPAELINQTVIVTGIIDSLPETKASQVSFTVRSQQITSNGITFNKLIRIRLSWYFAPQFLQVGEKWQLSVRLKKPTNYKNIGAFDYQKWLFEQRIVAIGYVQASNNNHLIKENTPSFALIDRYRERIANDIKKNLNGKPLMGLITALAVGMRSDITEDQWSVLRGTGTNHLFAIAGLHIGFVAGMAYFIINFLWRRLGKLPLYLPTQQAAVLAALLAAVFYSAQAGFSLPTQRAVIMTAVFLLATLLRRKLPLWHAWSLALILILVLDPLAVLSASFWLSFGAVALIIYGVTGRVKQSSIWWKWGRTQWVLTLGLIPLSLLFFQQASLIGFIANAIAIPWVGFIVLPLSFLGSLFDLFIPIIGNSLIHLAEYSLELIWPLLTYLSQLAWMQWYAYLENNWLLLVGIIAIILLLAPCGFPARWLGLIWGFPLLLWSPAGPKNSEGWFSLLDVNQGFVAVIHTKNHTLVYEDSQGAKANNNVVLPYLRYWGYHSIDTLIVNSNNNFNFNLLAQIPVKQVLLNKNSADVKGNVDLCRNGQSWNWDGIHFESLAVADSKNNNCLLKITNHVHVLLLTSVRSFRD